MADLSITGEVVVTSEKAEGAFDRVGAKAGQMASKVQAEATKAGAAVDSIGAGAEQGAEKFTRAESRMRSAIQKSTRELEMLGKTASQKFEAQLEFKGLDKAKFQPFLDELRQAEEAAKRAENGINSMSATAQMAGRAMALAFSGAAITGFLGKVVSVQREFDVLNSSLKTVTGGSAAAEREMAWLKDFAKETPFGLAQATQGFVKMKALGLDPTRAALTSFGNIASAMGKDLNQMIEAVADASTGEFERLKEFGIKAKKEGDNVSLTFQGVTTTIKNSAAEITQYLENIGNVSFGGAMEERAKTLDGTIAALGDTWDELFRTVSTNNVGSLIFDSVTLANGALEDATTILRAMGGAAQDASRDTGALSTIQNGIATVFETVAVLGANLKFVLVGIGTEIGGLAAQVAQAAQFNFAGVAAIREQMVADAEAARREIDATTARILNARKEQEEYARYATRNASAATDPRRVDLGGSTTRAAGGASSGAAKAVKETISEYDKLIKKLSDELPAAAAAAEAAQMGYNKTQTEFLALAASPAWAKFTNDQRATVAALFENKIASEQSAEAAKTLAKANLDAAASRDKYLTSLSAGLDKIQADIAAQEEATARMGLSKEAIADLDAAKLEMLATDLELQAIKAMDRNLDEQTYDALKKQAQGYRDLAKAKQAGAAKEVAVDEAKKAAEEWQRTSDQISQSITDALMRGFESGKNFAQNLRDTVVNMFKSLVLQPVIKGIVSPFAGALTGALGLAGTAAQAGQGAGGALSAIGSIGSGYSLLSGIGGTFGGGLSAGFGGLMGSLGLSATGSTLGGAMSAGGIALQSGNIMGGLGTIAGALGPIALGIGLLTSFIKKPTPHSGAGVTYSAAGGLTSGASQYSKTNYGFGAAGEYSAESNTAVASVAKGIATALDSTAVAFGKKAGFEISTAFADDKGKDGAWGQLAIKLGGQKVLDWRDTQTSKWAPKEFADGEAGLKEYQAAVAASMRDALSSLDLPGWVDSVLQDLGDAPALEDMEKALSSIALANDAMAALGSQIGGLSGLSDEATASLIDAFGGVETFAATASEYANVVLTDAEKVSLSMTDISSQFEALGMAVPTSVSALQDLISAQDLTTDAGREAVASLMTLGTSFATVMDQMQQSIGLTGDSLKSVFQNVLKQAHSAEEARVMGEQAAGQLLMDAIGNALVGTVTDLVSNAVLQPITQSIVGAAAQAATMDVAAASVAGMNLAAGGAAGGMNLAAGGAAGGANVAAGGAVAGQGLAEVVGKAIGVTNAMVEILSSADFQTAFGNAITAIGSISGTLFKGLGTIESSMPGFGGGSSAITSGGGGGGSSAVDVKDPLEDLLNERRQLEIELMKAQGKEEEALAEIRKDAIEGMTEEAVAAWDYNRALEKQIEQAQQLASLQEDQAGLQIALLQAQGKEEEALALIREQAIKGMSAEAVALYDANRAVEEQIRVLESLADFAKAGKELRAELLALQGDTAGANALLRQLAVEGLTALEIAAYDANEALKKQISTLKERQSLEDKLADLLGDSTAKRKRERDAIDESNRAIYDRITAIEDSKTAAQAALSALEKSVQAEKDKLAEDYNAQVKGLQERVSSIGEVVRDLDAALKSVRGTLESTTEQSQIAARLTLQSVLSAVNAGASVSSFSSVISQAAGTLSKNDTSSYTDRASFVRAQAKSGDLLHALNEVGGAQLTTAELQLETLEDWRDDELRKLDNILENARTQLEAAQGTHTGVLTLSAAMAGFSAAIAALGAAMLGTVTGGVSGSLLPPGTIVSRPRGELPHYAGGGAYGGGLAIVGEHGPELINFNQPGMVYTAQQTSQILNNSEVLAELRAVRRELSDMKAEARRTADAVNGRPEQPMLVETVA